METKPIRRCECGKDATHIRDYLVLEQNKQSRETAQGTEHTDIMRDAGIVRARLCDDCLRKNGAELCWR